MIKGAQEEWGAWQKLMVRLRLTGAVTEMDCKSALSARDTDGQRLMAQIREWGDAYSEFCKNRDAGKEDF